MIVPRAGYLPITSLIGWLLAVPTIASAHHSGLYDEDNVVTIAGTITAVAWINPHVHFTLDAEAEDGRTEQWGIEGTSINALERWGLKRDWFQIGDRLSVTGAASRFGLKTMAGATAVLASGELVVLWPTAAARLGLAETGVTGLLPLPSEPALASSGQGFFRVWTPRGRPPRAELPLTAAAREAVAAYEPLEDDPALRCEPAGMPVMLDTPYPVEFLDEGDRITIRFEEWDAIRTVYMSPRNGIAAGEPTLRGTSFGRWEGDDTLAIFTTEVDYPYYDDLGTPQSDALTVLERYTLAADETRLDWEVTVTDPATFAEPVVRNGYFAFEPGEVIKPYNCTLMQPE